MRTIIQKSLALSVLLSPYLGARTLEISIQSSVVGASEVEKQNKELLSVATPVAKDERPKVQIALLLDTSGSMDGLIDQAKTQLWKIVNSFAKVEKDEKVPRIEVALYEYGNDKLNIQDNYIRRVSSFTSELDDISEQLFLLSTDGGSEYCGAVIKQALNDLQWDDSTEVYKAIFIAGNEAFTQGSVSATESCQRAIREGVVVNTIHCGKELEGINGGWKAGALAAEGDFLMIDQDKAIVHITAPQDEIIIKLSKDLNATYIPYGTRGQSRLDNQAKQDRNAQLEVKKGAAYSRAVTKGSASYSNASWDVVDYCLDNGVTVNDLDEKQLPEEVKSLDDEEKIAYVKEKAEKRRKIQEEIQALTKERDAYVLAEKSKLSEKQEDTLDGVITKTIYKQVEKNGFNVK